MKQTKENRNDLSSLDFVNPHEIRTITGSQVKNKESQK